jgi:membrane-associated protease RseP (regulator of RpoE activity)
VEAAFEDPPAAPRRTGAWIPVSLFLLTFLSAIFASVVPTVPADDAAGVFDLLRTEPWRFLDGLPFAATLMGILLAHEMGHWLMARHHGVDQTLPYFIPAPTIFGTLGALILMRSQPPNRRVLLDVAAAGPFAGLVVAVPAMAWGLSRSTVANGPPELLFGSSLLVGWLSGLFGPGVGFAELSLHPVAVAGWVGLFVTSLNLIPAAQLDGGHVAYALFGERQERLSMVFVACLFGFGLLIGVWSGNLAHGAVWVFWPLFLFVIGIRHPPVRDERLALDPGHRAIAWLALLVFILTFVPVPVERGMQADSGAAPAVTPGKLPRHQGPTEEFRL